MTRKLRVVDDAYLATRRAYVLWPGDGDEDFISRVLGLESAGRILINGDEDRAIDDVDLRLHLQCLVVCDDLVLPDTWWTSATAHQLVTVASWLGIKFINASGAAIPTVSAAGGR